MADKLLLVFPDIEHEVLWRSIIKEFDCANEEIYPFALKLNCDSYDNFLKLTKDFTNGTIPPNLSHLISATTYFLMDAKKDKIYGAVNIRHHLNEYLLKIGGHIGYGVAPSERRKGYATKMLSLALDKCRDLKLDRILVTCDKGNIGSAKTIIKNNGILEDKFTEESGNIVQRYWIFL